MQPFPTALVVVYLLCAAIGVAASLTERRRVLVVAKPLTTALLLLVVGTPGPLFAWLVDLGILFSLGGDIALLFRAKNAFLVGLAIFLGAHISYIAAFTSVAAPTLVSAPVLGCAVLMAAVSIWLLRRLWPGAAGIRAPLVIYAIALSTMVTTAIAAARAEGPVQVPSIVGIGAALFYIGDASLALDQFRQRIPYAPLLTLGVYWIGQLAIALAARFAGA